MRNAFYRVIRHFHTTHLYEYGLILVDFAVVQMRLTMKERNLLQFYVNIVETCLVIG